MYSDLMSTYSDEARKVEWTHVARQATLYFEKSDKREASGAKILTRGNEVRAPQTDLLKEKVHFKAGRMWVANMPDLFNKYEAYLEINAVCVSEKASIPHPFKLQIDVKKNTFSAAIQKVPMIQYAEIIGEGIILKIRLTELDKINKDKFDAIKGFVEKNDIPGIAQTILNKLPIDATEAVKLIFNSIELLDTLNDDDRVWIEFPIFDFYPNTTSPLYEGSYAIVSTPLEGELPIDLYEIGGDLYKEYSDDKDNIPFKNETYLTWYIYKSSLSKNGLDILMNGEPH